MAASKSSPEPNSCASGLSPVPIPEVRAVGHVHPRGAHAAPCEPIRVEDRCHRFGVAQLDARSGRGRFARVNPVAQSVERGLQDVMVLRGEVDGVRQLLTHQDLRRRVRGKDVVQPREAGVDPADLDRVVVGVGSARDLPCPQMFVVGLPRPVVAESQAAAQVGLGDDRHQRHSQVVTERDRLGRAAGLGLLEDRTPVQRCGGRES